jgi:hypothetical protein
MNTTKPESMAQHVDEVRMSLHCYRRGHDEMGNNVNTRVDKDAPGSHDLNKKHLEPVTSFPISNAAAKYSVSCWGIEGPVHAQDGFGEFGQASTVIYPEVVDLT